MLFRLAIIIMIMMMRLDLNLAFVPKFAFPRCCVTVSKKIPQSILKSGVCDFDALILHFRNKLICAHPRGSYDVAKKNIILCIWCNEMYLCGLRFKKPFKVACNTPKRKENLKSHHMTPLTAQYFGVLKTTVFTIMTAYTKHGKTSSANRKN
uniref:Chemokine interleukin-8-like domain-containing protein n=1 Tax=Sinocyclocheilus grahami TaxID=75366 RepID=A0A672P9S8_SINGR